MPESDLQDSLCLVEGVVGVSSSRGPARLCEAVLDLFQVPIHRDFLPKVSLAPHSSGRKRSFLPIENRRW